MPESAPAAYRHVPPSAGTHGDLAAEVGYELGLEPDADQQDILDAIFAYQADDPTEPAFFEAGVVAPRQNIKTSTLVVAAATDLFVFRQPLHVWTAHLFRTSRSTFLDLVARIDNSAELRRMCKPPRMANNQEAVSLLTGEEIQFYSRSKGGGRGITAPRLTLDEALFLGPEDVGALLPTMATIEGAQVRYGSSGGLRSSRVLRLIRDRGRAGVDPSLTYFEWAAEFRECGLPECSHAFGVEGCALDDRELWWQANVALGRRIGEERIAQFRASMPPEEFAREFLTWWDDPPQSSSVIDPAKWEACRDRASTFGAVTGWAVAVARDLSWSAVAACGVRDDGRLHVEIPEDCYRRGTDWVAAKVARLRAAHGEADVVVESKGPRSQIVDELEGLGVAVKQATGDEVVEACGELHDIVHREALRHLGQPVLDVALRHAGIRRTGDAWAWSRSASSAEISPLMAVTLAAWGANHLTASSEPFMVIT